MHRCSDRLDRLTDQDGHADLVDGMTKLPELVELSKLVVMKEMDKLNEWTRWID